MKLRLATALLTSGLVVAGTGAALASVPAEAPVPAPVGGVLVLGRVLVHYKAGVNATVLEHANGASRLSRIADLGVDVLKVPAGAEQRVVDALRRSGKVDFAERDGVVRAFDVVPNDPYWPQQWSTARVHAPSAWSTSTGSAAVTVAVLDTGLDSSLSEFAGRIAPGYNVLTGSSNTTDDNSHGTSATGVALAQGNNGSGVAGLCWQCGVMPVKVLDANGSGTDGNVASGIVWAVDHGAKVLSLSLGSSSGSSTLASAVSYAQTHGALVIAAAGNNGSAAPTYPAGYSGVLSVAASDQNDALYTYSEYGSWISVAAPGTNYSVWPGGGVYSFGGTSSATPLVSGLAATLWSAAPGATADAVKNAITSTTVPLSSGTVATGRVDAGAAMAALTGASAPSPSSSPSASAAPSPTPTTAATASPTPTATASPSPATSPTSSPSPTVVTGTASGALNRSGVANTPASTSGGNVTVTLTSATGTVTLSLLDAAGKVMSSVTGTAGAETSAILPSGAFTVQVKGTQKTRWSVSYTYAS